MANIPTGFPDETNTGVPAGTSLTAYDGPMTITQDGTVIDGKIIDGSLRVEADNVVIKNSQVNYDTWWGIDAQGAQNITVQDSTLVGPGSSGDSNAAILGSGTFLRNDISQSENGIVLGDGASTVKGNYIHDLEDGGPDPHYDGISVQGGQDGVLIEDNTVIARDTSAVFIKNDFGPINDVTVNHNYLAGDPVYNIYVDGRADGGAITDVTLSNNYLEKGYYGYYSIDNSSPVVSGNIEYLPGETPPADTTSGSDTGSVDDARTITGTGDDTGTITASADDAGTSTAAGDSAGMSTATGTGDDTGTITASAEDAGTSTAVGDGAGTSTATGDDAGTSTASGDTDTATANGGGADDDGTWSGGDTGASTHHNWHAGSRSWQFGSWQHDSDASAEASAATGDGDLASDLGAAADAGVAAFKSAFHIASGDGTGGDTFQFDSAVFTALGEAGALNADYFSDGRAAPDANDHVVYNQATGNLSYDPDGSGDHAAVHIAHLKDKPALTADDFQVI